MESDRLTVRCACGWHTSGNEDEVVEATREHGQRVHNMSATRDQVLAMAVPAVDSEAPSTGGQGTPAA